MTDFTKIGFTGTREGVSAVQQDAFLSLWETIKAPREWHHGDCIGSDDQITSCVGLHRAVHFRSNPQIVAHPGPVQNLRARNSYSDIIRSEKPFLVRNCIIVDCTELLIATPLEMTEQSKGGTWYTIRYARKAGKALRIIWRDGTITEE